jgi:aminoglycoside/choline kinase family phosphotransferase
LVYVHGLPALLADGGLEAPDLLGSFERSETEIALWLEDLGDPPAPGWTSPSLARAARALGVGQGALVAAGSVPGHAWLSRRFLRDYSTSKQVDWDLIHDAAAWQQPLIRQYWPASLQTDMARLYAERDRWLGLLETLPRTLCHLDFWPNNLVAVDSERTAVLDWAFSGDGALGEDVGNLVPDAIFDHFLPAADLPELDHAVYVAYVEGLREGGWNGDERLVRLAMCASAVKYLFLVPRLLERASEATHFAYGGAEALPAELRYGHRGATLAYLAQWAEEARTLAVSTGRG